MLVSTALCRKVEWEREEAEAAEECAGAGVDATAVRVRGVLQGLDEDMLGGGNGFSE